MSDTAIFVLLLTKDLGSNGHLPGDTRHLRQHLSNDERVVHLETVLEAPLGDKPSSLLLNSGSILSILPTGSDVEASLVGGFMARLHEFICAYPNVSKFVLAAAEVDRLAAPAQFLQKAGYVVTILGPDRSRLDAVRYACDDVELWSGRGNSSRNDREPRESRDSRDSRDSREDKSSQLDPYDVLVEEVSKGRNKGQRVLLTSLKQRMRRRLRRFDETRLKDLDGKPMKKFKDFIEDAVNRGLIQLVERGNRSQVLLPGEEIPPEEEDSNGNDEETDDDDDDNTGDPLLDTVDSPEESEDRPLTEKDFDVGSINEDADAPSKEFVVFLENTLPESGLTLPDMLKSLADAQEKDALQLNNRELKTQLQNAFYNELLEPVDKESPTRYIVVDDWKDIIEFL